MADNILVTPGTGSTVAADDIAGILHQRIKVVIGADGVSNGDVSAANPMPTVSRTQDGAGNAIGSLDDGNTGKALEVAMAATGFVASTLNSTTTQLASGATFTGVIETIFNQQAASILLTSDKKGTLTVKQYIDAAGTFLISSVAYSVLPNIAFSRAVTINGNFFNLTFQNTDSAITTTLNINTAYGTLPATTNLLSAPVSLDEVAGTALTNNSIRADALLKVSMEPTSLFYDTFDTTLDTVDRWTVAGTAPSSGTGQLTMNQGTAANATSGIQSKASFQLLGSMFVNPVNVLKMDSGLKTGAYRFWGLGIAQASPTAAAPIVNGVGFEWAEATGILSGVVWSNAVRTQAVSFAIIQPTDGNFHRFAILYKTSRVYFEIDGVNVGSIALPNPQVSTLPSLQLAVNGAATVTPAAVMISSFIGVGDTSRIHNQISDGTFPWRKAQVSALGALSVRSQNDISRVKKAYSATFTAAATEALVTLTPYSEATAGTAGTSFAVTAGKTLRIESITVSTRNAGAATQGVVINVRLNSGAAVTATSPLIFSIAAGTSSAVAGIPASNNLNISGGWELTGTHQFGVSQVGTATANNIVTISGYEY